MRQKVRQPPDPWHDRIVWESQLEHMNGTWRGTLSGVRWRLELTSAGSGTVSRGVAVAYAAGGGFARFIADVGGVKAAHSAARDVIRTAVAQVLSCSPVSDY